MIKVKNTSNANVMLIDGTTIKPRKTAKLDIEKDARLKSQVETLISRGILYQI